MEHNQRFDMPDADPTGLKPVLARYANNTLSKLKDNSTLKHKIMVGRQSVYRTRDLYRDEVTGRYDGLHMYGRQGYFAHTDSVLRVIQSCLGQNITDNSSSSHPRPSFHDNCPQTKYQEKQRAKLSSRSPVYNVPVYNHYEVLGN